LQKRCLPCSATLRVAMHCCRSIAAAAGRTCKAACEQCMRKHRVSHTQAHLASSADSVSHNIESAH
jgi:hypothetical protein